MSGGRRSFRTRHTNGFEFVKRRWTVFLNALQMDVRQTHYVSVAQRLVGPAYQRDEEYSPHARKQSRALVLGFDVLLGQGCLDYQ